MEAITINEIDTNRLEGRYLLAAIAMLSEREDMILNPDQLMGEINSMQEKMFDVPLPEADTKLRTFRDELTALINKYSMENVSDTPDFILSEYVIGCMNAFNAEVARRDRWYGVADRWANEEDK